MSQEIPLYCDTCMKYFSGPASAQQHFESIDHQRKEASRQQAGQGGNALFCSYCNKQCNSLMQYREHNASPMHLAVVERARRFNSPAPSPAPQGSTQLDSQVSALGDHYLQLTMNEGANKMAGKQSYDFDGVRGYCNVCELELTSHAHARQHLNGEKHKKKERQFVQGTLGGNLSCALCQVPFSGQENAQQHMASERHKRREAELARGTVPITTGLPVGLTARVATPAMSQVPPPPPASWLVQPGTPATPEQLRMQPEPAMEYSFDGNRGHCLVCDIELTSPEHAMQHLAGRPHKKKAERRKTTTQTASYPLYCQVCQVQMPDQAAAQSHYASENHRQPEGQLQQMHVFPARPQATPQESEDTEKKMKWYAEEAASSGMQRSPGMLHGGTGPLEDLRLPKERLQDAGDCVDAASPHPQTSVTPSSLSIQRSATNDQNSDADQTSVMNAHIPGTSQVLVTEGSSVIETSKTTQVNHAVPLEFTQDGALVCYVCGGEKINGREAIAQHLGGNANHEERMKKWIGSKLSQPDNQRRSSPPPAMEMKAGPSMTAYNSPLPQTVGAAGDTNCIISSTNFTLGGTSAMGTLAKSALPTPCLPVSSPAGAVFSCMICVERFSGPVPMDQHNSSERHRKKVTVWNHLQQLSPRSDGLVRPIYMDGDLTPWYPCDVCLLLMNSAEVLHKHKESPKHKEQVEKREQFMKPSENSIPLVISANPYQAQPSPGRSPLTVIPSIAHPEKPTGSPIHNPSDVYQRMWSSLKEGQLTTEPRPPQQTDREAAPTGNPGSSSSSPAHSRIAGVDTRQPASTTATTQPSTGPLMSLISRQLEATKTFNPSSFADVIPASQPPVAPDPAHSFPSFSRFRDSHDSDNETLEFNDILHSMPPSSHNHSTRSGTEEKSPSKANSPVIDPVVNCATPVPIKQRVAIVTPGKQAGEERGNPTDTSTSTSCDTCQDAPGGAGGGKPRPHNPLKNRSRGARTVGLGLGGEGDSSEEDDVGLAETFEKQCSLRGTTEDSSVNFDVNLASTGSWYGTLPTSLTSQPGDPGSGGSAGQGCRQRTLGLTDSNQDDLDHLVSLPCPAVLPGTPLSSRAGAGLPLATERPYPSFKHYCPDCNRPMNTLEAYHAHINGQAHKQKVASKAAPKRELGMTQKTQDAPQARQAAQRDIINMEPRSYQLELFCKAMESDSIIFLPTGTGKTVIAAMVVSHMLHLNPTRPVLFLVDKVLLVLQQGQVIARELKNRQFLRSDLNHEDHIVNRELKIALLCGGLRGVEGTPLYKHDVIVTTAAYCENLLADNILHWEDFSLVVLDEAHHCVGKHPYCNIMRNRHLELPADGRPKVLGLTASPAGKDTLDNTISMLKNLMKSLGHPRLAIIEGEGEKLELDQYQSKTKIEIVKAEFSHEERQLCQELKEYIVRCYFKLAEVSNIKEEAPIFSKHSMDRPNDEERVQACIKEIDDDRLKAFLVSLSTAKPFKKMKDKALFDFLCSHAQFTITTLMDIEGGAGVPFAVEELKKLSSSGKDDEHSKAEQYGLPAKKLMAFVNKLDKVQDLEKKMEAKGMHQVTLFGQLRHVLFSDKYIKWGQKGQEERPMALVLVRERVVATKLSEGLQKLDDVQALGLRVRHVVGHGTKAGDGMRVQQQKRVLDGLRGGRYQILVATSVAEEGVDIPECELVITLNPPDSVTALVQMRGRARKQGSNFIVICEGEEKKQKLQLLLQREKNMVEAARRCLRYNKD